ncbi:MAG: DUF3667 domain-containing protein [Betaproteobacteria bacterium]
MESFKPLDPAIVPAICPNCGASISGHYCANCGQETTVTLPTFRAFMRDAAGRYVAIDGRLWRTLYALIARPGFLTLEYFAGRRRRYIRPARLFLVLYLLLFAFIGIVQSPADLSEQVVFVSDQGQDAIENARIEAEADDAATSPSTGSKGASKAGKGVPAGAVSGETSAQRAARVAAEHKAAAAVPESERKPQGLRTSDKDTLIGLDDELNLSLRINGAEAQLPDFLRKRYEHFRNLPREEKAERLYAGVLRYGTYAMIMLLPVFALLMMLAYMGGSRKYPRRPRRYAEHLVYSAHVHAFAALIIMLIIAVPWPPMRAALALWVAIYLFRARTRVYGGSWWAGIVRAAVIAAIYFVLVSLAMVALIAVSALMR